jgi:hypothetical protein
MDPEIQQLETVSEDSEIAVGIFNKLHWHLARESMLLQLKLAFSPDATYRIQGAVPGAQSGPA